MDRDALIEGMAEAMSRDQLERRGQHIVPWSEEIHLWKEEQRARARAALAVAEPVVRADERLACLNVAHRWTRDGHSATAHGIILGIEERTGGTP